MFENYLIWVLGIKVRFIRRISCKYELVLDFNLRFCCYGGNLEFWLFVKFDLDFVIEMNEY